MTGLVDATAKSQVSSSAEREYRAFCIGIWSFQFVDENECKYRPCDVFAHCTNTLGSFTCTCFPGYLGDGLHCEGKFVYFFLFLHTIACKTSLIKII